MEIGQNNLDELSGKAFAPNFSIQRDKVYAILKKKDGQ